MQNCWHSLSQHEVRAWMRKGAITSRCEAGAAEDAGRWRLTFHFGNRACQLIVDGEGAILQKSTFLVKPAQRRRPSGDRNTK